MVKDFDELERNLTHKLEAIASGMAEMYKQAMEDRRTFDPNRMLTLQLHVTFEEAHELISLLQRLRQPEGHEVSGGGSH